MKAKLKDRRTESETQADKCSRGQHVAGAELIATALTILAFTDETSKYTRILLCKHCKAFYPA